MLFGAAGLEGFSHRDTEILQHKAPDPVPQPYYIEVNEQPYLYPGKFDT